MAEKKVGLRVAWSGDHFRMEEVRFDDQGAWDKNDKPIAFTPTEAAEVIEHALDAGIALTEADPIVSSPQTKSARTAESGSGQE